MPMGKYTFRNIALRGREIFLPETGLGVETETRRASPGKRKAQD